MKRVVIDCGSLCNISKHAMKGTKLSYRAIETNVLYNFISQIISLSKKFETNKFIFAWDSDKSKRTEIYPSYKIRRRNRKKERTEEEKWYDKVCYEQFTELKNNTLRDLGFRNVFEQEGYEADDVIASIVKDHYVPITTYYIISSDKDFYQLLSPNVQMYNIQTKKKFTHRDFISTFHINPHLWWHVLSIAGCGTDEVKGIEKIGIPTAIDYLKGDLSIRSHAHRAIESEGGRRIIERNMRLVRLPLQGIKWFGISEDELTIGKFEAVMQRYGFTSMLKTDKVIEWRDNLMGVGK